MSDSAPEFVLADRAMARLSDVVATLSVADLQRHTPCPQWRVRDVLAHLSGTTAALVDFTHTGRRELPDEPPAVADPIASATDAIATMRVALADTSAEPANRLRAAGDVAVEFTTHSWDLDPRAAIPEELAAAVLAFVEPQLNDALRQEFFAPEIPCPTDAPAGDRLMAFLGRDPAWQP